MVKQSRGRHREKQFESRQKDRRQMDRRKSNADIASMWSRKPGVSFVLMWFAIGLITIVVYKEIKFIQDDIYAFEQQDGRVTSSPVCQLPLAHGATYMIDPAFLKRADVLYSGLQILNKHDYPLVAVMSDMAGEKKLLATSIAVDKTIYLSVPVGEYGLEVLVGSKWCNLETGFSDGANILVDGGIKVGAGQMSFLEFYGSGLNPPQLGLAFSMIKPVNPEQIKLSPEVTGFEQLELLQSQDGHYFSAGSVNGVPVVFMIDTGATTVSISSEVAAQAGIEQCIPISATTANGIVNACSATVAEVTFGNYQITDVGVTVMPNMPGGALLGMNVLRNFRIEQVDDVMRISVR